MAWEYKITGAVTEEHMTLLGLRGWELVTVIQSPRNAFVTLYWKRPAPADAARSASPRQVVGAKSREQS